LQINNLQVKNRYKRLKQPSGFSRSEIYEQFTNTLLLFVTIVVLHSAAMIIFEGLSLKNAIWLTLTSITTVGYGDLSAKTDLGRLSTIILIYVGGIALLAKLVAEYIDFRSEKRDKKIKGMWEWKNMKDHILIINTPIQDTERYVKRLVEQIKLTPSLANLPLKLLTDDFPEGLPHEVRDLGVVHVHGRAEDSDYLDRVNIKHAKYIILVSRDYSNNISDSINFDILNRIEDIHCSAYILSEVVEDNNRKRFRLHGADSVVRPIRAYPEIITRALEAPGTEQILENLFTHKGDYPQRFEVVIRNMKWGQVASRIISAEIGTPLGYIDDNKKVHTNPKAETQVNSDSIIVLVHGDKIVSDEEIAKTLAKQEQD
jgi:voltage-gated potassium channel